MATDTMYALSIQYNDNAPFTAISSHHGMLGLSFYNSDQDFVHLRVLVKHDELDKSDYWLRTIRPGDRLRITYRCALPLEVENISEIEDRERVGEFYKLPHGQRIGFDVDIAGREAVRLSHPSEGSFMFILGNIPRTHARCQVMAENEIEDWQWQLDDLYVDSSIGLTFVETTWNTPFPRISQTPAYSTTNWTPIPPQTGHPFHGKLDSQSSANWTPIPLQTGQFEAV